MKFQPRKYYKHDKGRTIAVLGTVLTHAWGEQLVIEETDKTGSSISCAAVNEDVGENWTEIGYEEFIREFKNVV